MVVHCPMYHTHTHTKNGPLVQSLGTKQQVRESAPTSLHHMQSRKTSLGIAGDIRFGDDSEPGSCCLILDVIGWVIVHTQSTACAASRIASGLLLGRVSTDHHVHQASCQLTQELSGVPMFSASHLTVRMLNDRCSGQPGFYVGSWSAKSGYRPFMRSHLHLLSHLYVNNPLVWARSPAQQQTACLCEAEFKPQHYEIIKQTNTRTQQF